MKTKTLTYSEMRTQLLRHAELVAEANPDGMGQEKIKLLLDAADLMGRIDEEEEEAA